MFVLNPEREPFQGVDVNSESRRRQGCVRKLEKPSNRGGAPSQDPTLIRHQLGGHRFRLTTTYPVQPPGSHSSSPHPHPHHLFRFHACSAQNGQGKDNRELWDTTTNCGWVVSPFFGGDTKPTLASNRDGGELVHSRARLRCSCRLLGVY